MNAPDHSTPGVIGMGLALLTSAVTILLAAIALWANFTAVQAYAELRDYAALGIAAITIAVGLGVWRKRPRHKGLGLPLVVAISVAVLCSVSVTPRAWRIIRITEPARQPVSSPSEVLTIEGETYQDRQFRPDADLRGSRMANSVLINVDLRSADLSESDLRNATLIDVNLSDAKLCGVDARGADLSRAMNVDKVSDWSFFYYDEDTRMPGELFLEAIAGPVAASERRLLYQCESNNTNLIETEPSRDLPDG